LLSAGAIFQSHHYINNATIVDSTEWTSDTGSAIGSSSVYSIHDPTEVAIQKMIEASQRMITINSQGEGINPAINRHLELEIKTLQNASRDEEKLEALLKVKERQKEEAMHIEDTERLVTEIGMLQVVLHLVSR
jgi:hypothetical protein